MKKFLPSFLKNNHPRPSMGESLEFDLEWDLLGFLKSKQGGKPRRLDSLVVLTGSALCAEATACGVYMRRTWPETGDIFISTLRAAVEEPRLRYAECMSYPGVFCQQGHFGVSLANRDISP
jgi:hypothetical protein